MQIWWIIFKSDFILFRIYKNKIFLFKALPTCTDNIQNQDETDIDCGGTICTDRCSINQTCLITSDCNNATCVMGTCLGKSKKGSLEILLHRESQTSYSVFK